MCNTYTNNILQNTFTLIFFTQGGINDRDPHYEEDHTTKEISVPFGGYHEAQFYELDNMS
jgi:hypothetical protein